MTAAAVLTGDLIDSSAAGATAADAAMALLRTSAEEIARWPGATGPRFTRYRGDGWQVLVAPPGHALRAAVVLAAQLRADAALPQTRIAIGFGPVDVATDGDLSAARGKGFEAAGHALDRMGADQRLAVAGEGMTPLHRATAGLIDERMTRWTPEQSQAMALTLDPDRPTQAAIAGRLGISAQAVSYRLRGAGAGAIRAAIEAWEAQATPGEGQT